MVLFLPTVSAIFPEKGREIAAEIVNNEIIKPLYSLPPKCVMKSFNSGRIKLKLVMKRNMAKVSAQKFRL